MLEHLVVNPRGGLCNRLRAIASAKRLCTQTGARFTIVWDWGDYSALFDDDTEWLPYTAAMDRTRNCIIPGYHHIRHLHPQEGGTADNRRVPVTTHRRIVVTSWYVFYSLEEKPLQGRRYEEPVLPWFPKPHPSVIEKVKAFRQDHFAGSTIGMHIRRTDHKRAIARSPDKAYFREGDRLIDSGHQIFLATDNDETLRMLQKRYGDKLLHYPKCSAVPQRWPRATLEMNDIIDDIMDLWLLVSCEFIVGSESSSYSRVAILLNGSQYCKALDRRVPIWRDRVRRIWYRCFRQPKSLAGTGKEPFGLRPGAVEKARTLFREGDELVQSALKRLLAEADEALRAKPVSVMDKPKPAASGDRHDYLSFAPYFWPDTTKKDGLPYIRRDCEINPESMSELSDKPRLLEMMGTTETLAFAYTLTGNESYAEQAARQLRTWFIDPETGMNANLNYAQVIPGHSKGRSFGILDGHYLLPALDAAHLLTESKHWTDTDHEKLFAWTKEFLKWLRTSKNGRKESSEKNNHGTLYDVQIIHLALASGQLVLAQETAESAKMRRIATQIKGDGSQPYELERPQSLQYSQYNLAAFFKLATRAEHAGIDLWHYQTAGGASILKALDFVMTYLEHPNNPWPHSGNRRSPDFTAALLQGARVYGDVRYRNVAMKFMEASSLHFLNFVR